LEHHVRTATTIQNSRCHSSFLLGPGSKFVS